MNLWSELLSSALVGTDRRPAPALDETVPFQPSGNADGPGTLLDAAAALTVIRRAGILASTEVATLPPAPMETLALVPPAAAHRLRLLLSASTRGYRAAEDRAELLAEWLAIAAEASLRAPATLLPELFAAADQRPDLRAHLAAVGAERARWLAGLRPEWAWIRGELTTAHDEAMWTDGSVTERTGYLLALRGTDPDRARDLLVQTWPQETPAARAALLGALTAGLGPADEEFCEAALDDRRKEVRAAAAALLLALPGSAYRQRMSARAAEAVTVGADGELVVTPPASCDKAMKRDGIEGKPPPGIGERAWWLELLLARTPLESDPEAMLGRPVADDWRDVLHRGWAQAALAQADAAWAVALVRSGFGRANNAGPATPNLVLLSLYEKLSPEDAVSVACSMLELDDTYVEYVLPRCPRPWPSELVRPALDRLLRHAARPGYGSSTMVSQAAFGLSPDLAHAVRQMAATAGADDGPDPRNTDLLEGLAETLTLRHEMHQEFA